MNQYSALARGLGKMFFAPPLKIVLQHDLPEIRHRLRGYGIDYPGSAVVQDNENHLSRALPTAELRRLYPGANFVSVAVLHVFSD